MLINRMPSSELVNIPLFHNLWESTNLKIILIGKESATKAKSYYFINISIVIL